MSSAQIGEDDPQGILAEDRALDPRAPAAQLLPAAAAGAELPDKLVDHVAGDLCGERRLAADRTLDRLEDLLGRAALDEIADDSGLEHVEHRVAVGRAGKSEHLRIDGAALELARDLESTAVRHAYVDDRDVGLRIARELDRLVGITRGPDEHECRRGVDQRRQRSAQVIVVFRDQDGRDPSCGVWRDHSGLLRQ